MYEMCFGFPINLPCSNLNIRLAKETRGVGTVLFPVAATNSWPLNKYRRGKKKFFLPLHHFFNSEINPT